MGVFQWSDPVFQWSGPFLPFFEKLPPLFGAESIHNVLHIKIWIDSLCSSPPCALIPYTIHPQMNLLPYQKTLPLACQKTPLPCQRRRKRLPYGILKKRKLELCTHLFPATVPISQMGPWEQSTGVMNESLAESSNLGGQVCKLRALLNCPGGLLFLGCCLIVKDGDGNVCYYRASFNLPILGVSNQQDQDKQCFGGIK